MEHDSRRGGRSKNSRVVQPHAPLCGFRTRGLRIDFTDEAEPILAGAVGIRSYNATALFDNIVVLPVDALPQSADDDSSGKSLGSN